MRGVVDWHDQFGRSYEINYDDSEADASQAPSWAYSESLAAGSNVETASWALSVDENNAEPAAPATGEIIIERRLWSKYKWGYLIALLIVILAVAIGVAVAVGVTGSDDDQRSTTTTGVLGDEPLAGPSEPPSPQNNLSSAGPTNGSVVLSMTPAPSSDPTPLPTLSPTRAPSSAPSSPPTMMPSVHPTSSPTMMPTGRPTRPPTQRPTPSPSQEPTSASGFTSLHRVIWGSPMDEVCEYKTPPVTVTCSNGGVLMAFLDTAQYVEDCSITGTDTMVCTKDPDAFYTSFASVSFSCQGEESQLAAMASLPTGQAFECDGFISSDLFSITLGGSASHYVALGRTCQTADGGLVTSSSYSCIQGESIANSNGFNFCFSEGSCTETAACPLIIFCDGDSCETTVDPVSLSDQDDRPECRFVD